LDVAHNVGKGGKLADIKQENGTEYGSVKGQEEYITNFYTDLYRRDPDVDGSIEEFLGEKICHSQQVTNSKLSQEQRELLEADLTFEELEQALGESNLKSAPGIDGYSNKFIKESFYVIGCPLFNCCKLCLDTGNLLDIFATAQIKLIPKKGDTTKIKNWRPISLLSNFYKILSRAINNRLKTVVNRVLSRAQKGFTKTRQIHEVIMNLSETMDFCKINKIKGAMVCVDQAKAFDSVDHNFMLKTFRFFGFGERFISWLLTIGTIRKACIIYDNGEKGNIFSLLRGTAQGDCPSPIIYNICAQILIFKIELSPSIRRVDGGGPNRVPNQNQVPAPVIVPIPVPVRTINDDFIGECNFETGKNESFADDSTTCTFLDYDDLSALKNILTNFARLSGLRCNFKKTSLMRIGDLSGEIDPRI
jgi:hypothetical protein